MRNSLNLNNHLVFKNEDEVYDFLYKEHTMEIFGHAGSVETSSMMDFNNFYLDMRDKHDILIVSDEMGKSKPASLFFLSKFGCQLEKVKFYSNSTINSMWNEIDVLLTANPALLLDHPSDKILIKSIQYFLYRPSNIDKFIIPTLSVKQGSFEEVLPNHTKDTLYLDPPYYLEKDKDNKMFTGIYPSELVFFKF